MGQIQGSNSPYKDKQRDSYSSEMILSCPNYYYILFGNIMNSLYLCI